MPGGLIGAGAVLAALISGLTVLLGALVNAKTARAVAKDTFRRQLLYDNVKPFLERLNGQIAAYERVTEAGTLVAETLDGIRKSTSEETKASTKAAAITLLEDLRQEILRTKDLWNSTSGTSVIARDPRLLDTAMAWLRSSHDFKLFMSNTYGITADPVKVAEMKTAAREAMWKAVELRIELEEAVIRPRGWMKRQSYRVARRLRKLGRE